MLRPMTNPVEFFNIHKDSKVFKDKVSEGNFALRQFISSFGFKASRELAEKIANMENKYES